MAEPKSAQRNPPWSRDELILALDFYLLHRNHIPGKTGHERSTLTGSPYSGKSTSEMRRDALDKLAY